MEITEITPERWPAVCAMIGDDAPQRFPALTLIAEVEGEMIGALLCEHLTAGGYSGRVFIDAKHRDETVASTLIDKATRKLQVRGVRCWRFDVIGDDASAKQTGEPIWSSLTWAKPPVYDDAVDVTRVRGAA